MPIGGDSSAARETVMKLVADGGFEPIDCGDSLAASWLETMTLLSRFEMAIQNRWKGTSQSNGNDAQRARNDRRLANPFSRLHSMTIRSPITDLLQWQQAACV